LIERTRFEREIENLRSETFSEAESFAWLPSIAPKGLSKRHFILVAGFDYEDPDENQFTAYCKNRIERILQKKPGSKKDPGLIFTLFDVGAGVVKSNEVINKKRIWVNKSNFTPVTAANNYSGIRFDKNPAGIMSITDVYDFVRAQSRSDPGSIQELNFFSHGFLEGPILVNSKDKQRRNPTRDPDDKDGRARKDFSPPNMNAAALKEFADAFSKDGFIWVWGCVFTGSSFQVLHRVLKSRKYHSKVKDDEMFELEFEPHHEALFFSDDPDFFPAMRADGTYARKFWRSFKEIKDFLQKMFDATYCKSIAKASQRKCFGALPGTYSLDEKTKNLPMMLVPQRKPPYKDEFSWQVSFYAKHLNISLDKEGRGYGVYLP
jgi:hypothetical protein